MAVVIIVYKNTYAQKKSAMEAEMDRISITEFIEEFTTLFKFELKKFCYFFVNLLTFVNTSF